MPRFYFANGTPVVDQMIYLTQHFLENSADHYPEKEAVVHGAKRYTYADIEKKANQLANFLIENDLHSGDRFSILISNSVEYIISYYGILKAGGVTVPLNTGLDLQEICQMIADSQSRTIITQEKFAESLIDHLSQHKTEIDQMVIVDGTFSADKNALTIANFQTLFQDYPAARPSIPLIDQDAASLIYTSGSTAKPKGVILKHINIVSNTLSIISYLELKRDERCLCILPFYYVFGKSLLNTHFAVAATMIVDNRFTFPNVVLKTMIDEQATSFSGVPSTFVTLLNRSKMKQMSFPSLRYITQAGGHMSQLIKKRLMEAFPEKKIYIMYGSTEASPRLTFLPPEDLSIKIDSIGKPIPNVDLRIFDDSGVEVQAGQMGEIAARGSNIMQGYWSDPIATQEVLRDDWYLTGDLGYCDADGYFYVTGRKRDLIKVGQYKVSTTEIEEVLYQMENVDEVAVIGVPDESLGESMVAFMVMRHTGVLSEEAVMDFCHNRLPRYKIPTRIVFTKALPKNDAGKILKQTLINEYKPFE
jgi:long-chain acyl-CoA synthetase